MKQLCKSTIVVLETSDREKLLGVVPKSLLDRGKCCYTICTRC